MIKVRATDASLRNNVKIAELGRIASPGEEFEVSESRYKVLSGNNRFHKVFVIKIINEAINDDKVAIVEEVINSNEQADEELIEDNLITESQPKKRRRKYSE